MTETFHKETVRADTIVDFQESHRAATVGNQKTKSVSLVSLRKSIAV